MHVAVASNAKNFPINKNKNDLYLYDINRQKSNIFPIKHNKNYQFFSSPIFYINHFNVYDRFESKRQFLKLHYNLT